MLLRILGKTSSELVHSGISSGVHRMSRCWLSGSTPWCIFGNAKPLKNSSQVRSDASVYFRWATIQLLVPGGGELGLTLITLKRLVFDLACTNVLVVDRQPWCEMLKNHGRGCLPSASLARFALRLAHSFNKRDWSRAK